MRKKDKRRKNNKLLNCILLLILVGMISYAAIGLYKESKIKTKKEEAEIQRIVYSEENIKEETQPIQNLNLVDLEQDGYDVIARLQIPKIGVDTNVLKEYSDQGLEMCVTRFWGTNPNEVGNFCIAGHNYIKENMFGKLKQLEIGDKIILTDNKHGIISYKIYDIYKVKPEDTTVLSQKTNGQIEITLITCTNYSKQRIIVKARALHE